MQYTAIPFRHPPTKEQIKKCLKLECDRLARRRRGEGIVGHEVTPYRAPADGESPGGTIYDLVIYSGYFGDPVALSMAESMLPKPPALRFLAFPFLTGGSDG